MCVRCGDEPKTPMGQLGLLCLNDPATHREWMRATSSRMPALVYAIEVLGWTPAGAPRRGVDEEGVPAPLPTLRPVVTTATDATPRGAA